MKKVIYLDNAASSHPKPDIVIRKINATLQKIGANPGRSSHSMALAASRILFETRESLAELLNLPSSERIIFTKNCTEGINLALKGILKPGDKVAVSKLEHNSVARPLETLKKNGVIVEYAPCDEYGLPDPKKVPKVKMLVTVAASNVTGAVLDIAALSSACKSKGVVFMLDAAQMAGSIPLDGSLCDILAAPGHKGLLGPQGTGFVWFKKGIEPDVILEGGTGSNSEEFDSPSFWPDRHEAGTCNTPGIAGLGAATQYLLKRGIASIRERETVLCEMILDEIRDIGKVITYPPYDINKKANLVLFNVDGADPSQLAWEMDNQGVALRSGLHCCPEAHRFLETYPEGGVRVSPGYATTKKDVKQFLKVLDGFVKHR
jgi:cysteine desulfurase family protein